MIIGAIVEGHGEEKVVSVVLNWLGVTCRIRRMEGVSDLMERARDVADQLLFRGATHILFFCDADAVGIEARRAAITAKMNATAPMGRTEEDHFFFIPTPELEAWLLSDEVALAKVLEVERVERVSNPEREGALAALEVLFRKYGKSYRKSQHGKEIADFSKDKTWLRCRSYELATEPLRRN